MKKEKKYINKSIGNNNTQRTGDTVIDGDNNIEGDIIKSANDNRKSSIHYLLTIEIETNKNILWLSSAIFASAFFGIQHFNIKMGTSFILLIIFTGLCILCCIAAMFFFGKQVQANLYCYDNFLSMDYKSSDTFLKHSGNYGAASRWLSSIAFMFLIFSIIFFAYIMYCNINTINAKNTGEQIMTEEKSKKKSTVFDGDITIDPLISQRIKEHSKKQQEVPKSSNVQNQGQKKK